MEVILTNNPFILVYTIGHSCFVHLDCFRNKTCKLEHCMWYKLNRFFYLFFSHNNKPILENGPDPDVINTNTYTYTHQPK